MEVKQIKCGKVRDGFDALTTQRKSFVLNLTFNPILRLKYHFGQKISRNLLALGNSLRMRIEISLLYWIIQNPHFNKILNDSPLSCVSNPILKSPRPAPHGAGRGQNIQGIMPVSSPPRSGRRWRLQVLQSYRGTPYWRCTAHGSV